jgi:hypothetical protein
MAVMKHNTLCACVLVTFAGVASAEVVECTEEQRRALVPSADEIRGHRETPLPAVGYPYATRRESWRFDLIVRVNAAGRIECYDEPPPSESRDSQRGIEGPRRAVIDGLHEWRYTPFLRDGRPVPVVITETLREYEMPGRRRAVPAAPLDKVRIALDRSSCFGTCPDYRVELFGDGRAEFMGNAFTVVRGPHKFSVDPAKVASLVERLSNSDVWSARSEYRAPITDSATYTLRIQLGKEVHVIEDYVGAWVGMPAAIDEFEDAVDEAAGSRDFIHFSMRALDVLQREGFRFPSLEGAKLLSRAVNDDDGADDAALARLVELGAPLVLPEGGDEFTMSGPPDPPLLAALQYRHPKTVEALLARGALDSNGRPSQTKIDAAFRTAIGGGDIALVKRIWEFAGEELRPSLTFEDVADGAGDSQPKIRKNADVITLVAPHYGAKGGNHREIVEFLVSHGSDLRATRASGDTLLHSAAGAEDVELVRFLLSKGLDPSAADNDDITPLGTTQNEEVSLLLLEAGSDPSKMGSEGYSYRRFVQSNGWYRVLAWLDAHGG